MKLYSMELTTRKYVQGCGFLSFTRNLSKKYEKQLLNIASKKLIHKADEIIGQFLLNKKADAVADENSRNVEEIIIPPEKREKISKKLR